MFAGYFLAKIEYKVWQTPILNEKDKLLALIAIK